MDCKTRKSCYNSKRGIHDAMRDLFQSITAPILVVSFNNEGFITREEMESYLQPHGDVHVIEQDFKRYVGAQIGIYSPDGEKVGKVSHLRNKEYLYVVVPARAGWKPDEVMRSRSGQLTLF